MLADTLLDVVDDPGPEVEIIRETKDGRQIVERRRDPAWAGLLKVRVETRQWWLSRRLPEQFGDFLHLVKKEESTKTIVHRFEVPDFLMKHLTIEHQLEHVSKQDEEPGTPATTDATKT